LIATTNQHYTKRVCVLLRERAGRKGLFRQVLGAQITTAALICAVGLGTGTEAGVSAAWGGAASLMVNGYFAWRVFAFSEDRQAQQAVATMYRAGFAKLVLSVFLLTALFAKLEGVHAIALLAAYLTVQASGLLAACKLTNSNKHGNEPDNEPNDEKP